MWISFSRPLYLLLLPLAAALLWYSARVSYADLSGARRWVAYTLRSLLVLALIFALAGAQLVKRSKEMVVVFALDSSYSISPDERTRALDLIRESLKHRRSSDRGALVVFGREAVVESESLTTPAGVNVVSRPSPTHTDIAAGLRLALGLVPPEAAGKVVLLTDGNENVGSAAQEILLAQANGVPVDVVP
ncbi:MAG: VWA domain-containing protein, partial [Armatimonadetes bacterium]|nr:VWA domain-containing protein [Armatimonadota bacterium]